MRQETMFSGFETRASSKHSHRAAGFRVALSLSVKLARAGTQQTLDQCLRVAQMLRQTDERTRTDGARGAELVECSAASSNGSALFRRRRALLFETLLPFL